MGELPAADAVERIKNKMTEQILIALLLIPMTVKDVRTKRLSWQWIFVIGTLGIIWNFSCNGWSGLDVIWGSLVGMGILLISLWNGMIGIGDGMLFLALGLICGGQTCITLLTGSLLCCLPAAVYVRVTRQKGGNCEIPFVPFVLIAWVIRILLNMG